MFTEPNSFSTLFDSISTIDFSEIEIGEVEPNLRETSKRFSDVSDQKAFLTVFTDLPLWIRAVLIYCFISVIVPLFISISANLLTPIVESYLDTSEAPERDKINHIKKLPLTLDNVSTDGLRFITGNNVRLRAEPSTKSVILDEMVLGQVVTILSKKKNWIEVMYEYDSGESLSGWVFNRYTKKFIK